MKIQAMLSLLDGHKDFRKISSDSLGVLISKAVGAVFIFLVQIPMTRLLGVEKYGLYVYVLSWVMVMATIVPLGMHTTVAKFFPAFKAQEAWGKLKGLFLLVFGIAIGMTLLLSGVVLAGFEILSQQASVLYSYIPAAALLLLMFSFMLMVTVFLRSLKMVVFAEFMDNIARPLSLLLIFLALFHFYPDAGAHNALWANNLAILFMGAVLSFYLWRKIPKAIFSAKADFSEYKAWFALGLPMMLMSGMNYLLNRTDIIMLGTIGSVADAGLYGVASRVSELSSFGLLAVHSILVPMISDSWQKGEKEHTQKLLTLAAWFVFLFSITAFIVLALFGPLLLPVFGVEFSASYEPMLLLLVARMMPTIVGPVVFLMALIDKQKLAAQILFLTVASNIAGNWLLIPHFGMMGAAVSTALSFMFWNGSMFVCVLKKMHINPSVIPFRLKPLKEGGEV
ncbi:MAG: oligosaccharide flippase family protein [Rhodospirillales bacterium]|nr:oligosaccharide flippase family protein [Rhodospirillales bacterium]